MLCFWGCPIIGWVNYWHFLLWKRTAGKITVLGFKRPSLSGSMFHVLLVSHGDLGDADTLTEAFFWKLPSFRSGWHTQGATVIRTRERMTRQRIGEKENRSVSILPPNSGSDTRRHSTYDVKLGNWIFHEVSWSGLWSTHANVRKMGNHWEHTEPLF